MAWKWEKERGDKTGDPKEGGWDPGFTTVNGVVFFEKHWI